MSWVRLWCDMPTDPKWRVIAKRSGRPIAEVIAVFTIMMANAGANADERGVLANWSDEDVAAALDTEPEFVTSIREAMQGKTLEGEKLTGWEKRQPKREDGSAERAKQWRERKRTQANAEKRPDADSEADTDSYSEEDITKPASIELSAAREGASDASGLAGLNGKANSMVKDVRSWMNGGDDTHAQSWLANFTKQYGSQVVKDSYVQLGTRMASGAIISRPLIVWAKIAADLDAGKKPQDPTPRLTARDVANQKSKEAFTRAMERVAQ